MEWFLVIFAGAVLLVVALVKLAGCRMRRPRAEPEDPDMDQIAQFIDGSLQGYPGRIRYRDVYGAYVWTCHSRLFTIHVSLAKEAIRYKFTIAFFCDLPFQIKVRRSKAFGKMKIAGSSGKESRKLLQQKEIPSFLQTLQFYDAVNVTKNGVYGTKIVGDVEGLRQWPETLGASITFTRFLLSYKERKEAKTDGESLCPYCRGEITAQEKRVSCSECRTIHHQDCWNETSRCSVFGCGNKSELEL